MTFSFEILTYKWEMDFNVKISNILLFNGEGELPHYSLHGHELEIVEEVKYLGASFSQI